MTGRWMKPFAGSPSHTPPAFVVGLTIMVLRLLSSVSHLIQPSALFCTADQQKLIGSLWFGSFVGFRTALATAVHTT